MIRRLIPRRLSLAGAIAAGASGVLMHRQIVESTDTTQPINPNSSAHAIGLCQINGRPPAN
jgi:hypothetical protein